MDQVKKEKNILLASLGSFIKKTRLYFLLIFLALVIIGIAFYFNSQPYWSSQKDINLFNQSILIYNLNEDLLPATDNRPSESSIIRAVAYIQQVISVSTNDKLISIAYYNLGTLMGDNILSYLSGNTPRFGIEDAIAKLEESVRLDPNNEKAKYNLELLEKVQSAIQKNTVNYIGVTSGLFGPEGGYSAGITNKGF